VTALSAPPLKRSSVDVSQLPTTVFGNRALTWWGTIGYIAAEGTTLIVCAVAYLYIRQNFRTWPPEGTPLPALTIPSIQAGLMLLSVPVMAMTSRAARRLDVRGTGLGLAASMLFVTAFCVLRWFEFHALHTRWDSNAYGSAAWAVVFAHATLLAAQFAESLVITLIFLVGPVEEKHLADADDVCQYWYFLIASWLVLYLLVFISPRLS
jgi:cytochrome c oxidase subunit III